MSANSATNYFAKYRQILLVGILAVICLAVLGSLLVPGAGNRQVADFSFPDRVPLTNWELVEAKPLDQPKLDRKVLIASQQYIYKQVDRQLQIEMVYEVGSLGHSIFYPKARLPIELKDFQLLNLLEQNSRQIQGVGFYTLFVYEARSHLISCINPHGGSTVLIPQFFENRYKADLQPSRWLDWLLGRESLQDRRCLWAHLSTPVDLAANRELKPDLSKTSAIPAVTDPTFPILEQAWIGWYEWWKPNFPPH